MDLQWKPLEQFEGLYEINRFGNIRSVNQPEYILQPHYKYGAFGKNRMPYVYLYRDGKRIEYPVITE